jgi:hypothetical protein
MNAANTALGIYGSEGWGFESLRARHLKPLDGKAFHVQGDTSIVALTH